ncbi:F0F1 ATP synthase subunit epsilon [Paenibacillus antri]|uniref:ATP synthase epsilon chain n=1 Tax=Paenibacillus antri TaxID=2582848 RepID=A0A5R9GBL6_9BACL|nr:F0F1 ATP synthase subunit epsilon [Paenibacillus antri]TLS50524.1 F0F1 ATP synthase subunit epsilon [Paenibacillus antri]
MSSMLLEIVTPERKIYGQEVNMVVAKGIEGELGILPNHIPMVTPLRIAAVTAKVQGQKDHVIAVHGGFMEVRKDKVVILAESAELPEEIDADRAARARERAEARLREARQEKVDFHRAEQALQRAMLRINVRNRDI